MSATQQQPNLEDRFLQPEGWRWHNFERAGRKMRFGTASPKNSVPDAVVVCLQGLSEFSEKYFETARWCLDNNLAFWTCDWVGQGKSMRYLNNPQKRHSHGFEEDVDDLQYFILEYIKHASVHPDKGRIPLALLGHSMGAHIGLHHLQKHSGVFECAAFTSPMVGIKAFEKIPKPFALTTTFLHKLLLGSSYVWGGSDFGKRISSVTLSSDTTRDSLLKKWVIFDPELASGSITFRWIHEALLSCNKLQNPTYAKSIKTPCIFALAGREQLTDNAKAEKFISNIENGKIINYPDAYHEILMENEAVRSDFLSHFHALIKETIIDRPETLKPF